MIPVEEAQIYKVNLKPNPKDSASEHHYKQLCIDELTWCRKNQEIIANKAKCLYDLCRSESGYKGKERCLDFAKLEQICDKYNHT
jgi:protein AbiQ